MKAIVKNTSGVTETVRHRLREGQLIVIGFIALFLLLALMTYHISDPGWSNSGQDGIVANAGGRVGAWIADFLLYFFGYLAYLFPLLMLAGAWLFYRENKQQETSKLIKLLRLTGFICVLIAGCGLAGIYLDTLHAHLPLTAGGVLGQIIAPNLDIIFNKAGATLFLLALLLIGITLFSGLSWLTIIKQISRLGLISVKFLRELFGDMLPKKQFQLETAPAFEEVKQKKIVPLFDKDDENQVIHHEVIKTAATEKNSSPILLKKAIVNKAATKVEPSKPVLSTITGLPSLDLLEAPSKSQQPQYSPTQLEALSNEVELRLKDFGIQAQVVAVHPGPVVTRFELQLAPGIKASRVTGLSRDLARSLSKVSVRVVEVIPGKSVIGLEIPNDARDIVFLQELLQSRQYTQATSPLSMALGKDIAGYPVVVDLAKMPHLLVAGTTGSGKSVSLNTMLLSLLFKATPQEVRLIMIDPKMLELSVYEGIPHLLTPVVTDMKEAANALRWCVAEMDRRYRLMAAMGVRNLAGFNKKVQDAIAEGKPLTDPLIPPGVPDAPLLQTLPFIVVLIDEFADMMMVVGKKVEDLIARIAQKARAAGIHMILATQRPSVDVITGLIKANIPTRIAFQVSSKIDSRTILDQQGAENLLGNGDMLYMPPGTGMPVRVHGVYASDEEVHRVVADWKLRGEPDYLPDILQENNNEEEGGEGESTNSGERDPLYDQAVKVVTETRRASISLVQRKLRIGYNRAATMLEEMQNAGIVSAMESNGTREVLAPPPIGD